MAAQFADTDLLRAEFWLAIPKVCEEALDDMVWLANYTRTTIRNEVPNAPEAGDDLRPFLSQEKEGGIPINADYIRRWQKKWHLDGADEKEWVHFHLMATVAYWCIDFEAFKKRDVFGFFKSDSLPTLKFSPTRIDPSSGESWGEFQARALNDFRVALADYRDGLRTHGVFKEKLERDSRWLVAHQLCGKSWKEIADSNELTPDGIFDFDLVRKAATRYADELPLTLRT